MDEAVGVSGATTAADSWLEAAQNRIDVLFGDGHAAAHPELVVAFLRAAAMKYQADRMASALEVGAGDLADAWREEQP